MRKTHVTFDRRIGFRIQGTVRLLFGALALLVAEQAAAQHGRPGVEFQIFQFPADRMPRIDGDAGDWAIVPERYAIGADELVNDEGTGPMDLNSLDVTVRVGWVKGMNRLYFLYEAYDHYWEFARLDLHNDTFEIVVDGDRSGGPLIDRFHPNAEQMDAWDAYFSFHGVHAQNYHIFTPAAGKDWEKTYRLVVSKAWNAMAEDALHPDGFLGYVQSTGKEPSTGQPATYDKQPDFEDYGLGAFLLAGSEIYRLVGN